MIGRARKFMRNVVADVGSCPNPADKVAVAIADAGRVVTVAVNAIGTRILGTADVVPSNLFLFRDVRVVNDDGRFRCRRRSSDYTIVRRDYEAGLREYFRLDSGVFVDVGAHIGKYSVGVGRQLGCRGRVIAIEPDASSFAMLTTNVESNGLDNVTALQVACGASDGRGVLHHDPYEPIKHSLRGRGAGVDVEVRSLDSLLPSLGVGAVDLLKVDAERMELEVLQGVVETLRRSPSIRIVLEADDSAPLTFLSGLGYHLTRTSHRFGANGCYYVAQVAAAAGVA